MAGYRRGPADRVRSRRAARARRALPLRFITASEVAAELHAGATTGHPAALPDWLEVCALAQSLPPLALRTLGAGEAAVIQLAVERGIEDVCIDEWRGRRAARVAGLRVTGSLGLLGRMKRSGLVTDVRTWVDRLAAAGNWYHPELIRDFLGTMGEGTR